MKNLVYFFTFLLIGTLIYSCAKDDVLSEMQESAVASKNLHQHNGADVAESRGPQEKVDVCHYDAETGEYHTITVNANALDAHLAHGDYEGECTECDPTSCVFCDHIDLMDFNEPAADGESYYQCGDTYYEYDYSYTYPDYCGTGLDYYEEYGSSYVIDNDYYRDYCPNDNDPTEEDYGYAYAFYEAYKYCSSTYYYGYVAVYYLNDQGTYVDESFYDFTQEAFEQALYCKGVIDGIAEANGMIDIYPDDGGSALSGEQDRSAQLAKEDILQKIKNFKKNKTANQPMDMLPDEIKEMRERTEKIRLQK